MKQPSALGGEDAPLRWEKQPRETAKAFYAFQIYRDLGPARSQSKTEERLRETGVASPTMVKAWSVRWEWLERVAAFDADEDRRDREAAAAGRRDAQRTQAMLGTLMLGTALRRLRGERGDPERGHAEVKALDPNELKASDVAQLARTGTELQRAGLGGTPLNLQPGAALLRAAAVENLVREVVALTLERMRSCALAVLEAKEQATPRPVEGIVAHQGELLVEEVVALYRNVRD